MAIDPTGEVLECEPQRGLAGELAVEVDFGRSTDATSGRAENFVNHDGEEFDGSLAITSGDLDREAVPGPGGIPSTCTADLDGTLTDESGGDHVFDGEMNGHFHGTGPDYVSGTQGGTYIRPNGEERGFGGNQVAGSQGAQRRHGGSGDAASW